MKAIYLVLLAGPVALAESRTTMAPEAQAHFDRGRGLYRQHDFTAAMVEFERGRNLDPNPDFDYALGQVYVELGDCKHAMREYNAFLATHPPDNEVAHARKSMARCEAVVQPVPQPAQAVQIERGLEVPTIDTSSSSSPSPSPSPSAPIPPTTNPVAAATSSVELHTSPDASPWYADVAGGVLAGAGIVGLATGVTYLALADHEITAANHSTTVAHLQTQAATGEHDRTIGTIGAVAGGAVAIGAVVRYALVARERHQPARTVSLAVDPTGAYAVWSGRF